MKSQLLSLEILNGPLPGREDPHLYRFCDLAPRSSQSLRKFCSLNIWLRVDPTDLAYPNVEEVCIREKTLERFDLQAWVHAFPNPRQLRIYEFTTPNSLDPHLVRQSNKSMCGWTRLEDVHASVLSMYMLALSPLRLDRLRLHGVLSRDPDVARHIPVSMIPAILNTMRPRILHLDIHYLGTLLKDALAPAFFRVSEVGWEAVEELILDLDFWDPYQEYDVVCTSLVRRSSETKAF